MRQHILRPLFIALLLAVAVLALARLALGASTTISTAPPNLSSTQIACIFTPGGTALFTACVGYAMGWAVLGLLLSFAIVALLYMLDKLANVEAFKGWYRAELSNAIKSTLILVAIFAAIFILGSLAAALAGSGNQGGAGMQGALAGVTSLYTSAQNNYISFEANSMGGTFTQMQWLLDGEGFANSTRLEYWVPIPIAIIPPTPVFPITTLIAIGGGANFAPIDTSLLGSITAGGGFEAMINFVVIPVTTVFYVLYYMFDYIMILGLGFFIPAGIALRAFPLLRSMGGTMIGIGIGLALIFPIVLIGFNLPVTNYISGALGIPSPSSQTCSQVVTGLLGKAMCAVTSMAGISPTATGSTIAGDVTAFLVGLVGPFTGVYAALNLMSYYLFNSILQVLLLIIDIVIVYTAADTIAGLLGGKITLGIGKFKLA